jgi:hypothetical protein
MIVKKHNECGERMNERILQSVEGYPMSNCKYVNDAGGCVLAKEKVDIIEYRQGVSEITMLMLA